jgi:hypothetical protein
MAILSIELDQLFTLLVPDFVVVGTVIFPSEPDSFQKPLSIKSNFVFVVTSVLLTNPPPQRRVILAFLAACHSFAFF